MYDIFGDIHGYYSNLEALFRKMGYTLGPKGWLPPDGRKAVFLGDLIDRGPDQLRVLEAVRSLCESGHAHCIMGNHELNAIAYATAHPHVSGEFVRKHSEKNRRQHQAFLEQLGEGSPAYRYWIDWFRTLPLFLDLGNIRAVHAYWNTTHQETLIKHGLGAGRLNDEHIVSGFDKEGSHSVYHALEATCKGPEILLPEGLCFTDHGGKVRRNARIRWWLHQAKYMHEIAIIEGVESPDLVGRPIPEWVELEEVKGSPVFIGHYWMQGIPKVLNEKVACLDYSVAGGGPLVGYRWSGEDSLTDSGFVMA